MMWDEEDSCCEEEEALARKSEMRNKVEVCDKELEKDPHQPGTMWVYGKQSDAVYMVTTTGYTRLSSGVAHEAEDPGGALKDYIQVYCVTIKRDRS